MPPIWGTNFSSPPCWATMPAWRMATLCCSPISAPTARAKSRWRCWEEDFPDVVRDRVVKFSAAAGMAEYSEDLNELMTALFPSQDIRETLGEVMAEHHLRQLRIAETEKYAHVTFFLNAGREEPYDGEDRILVPSPKVSTYDHKPEMSAYQVTDKLVEAIASGKIRPDRLQLRQPRHGGSYRHHERRHQGGGHD